jgi:hypothetical protein
MNVTLAANTLQAGASGAGGSGSSGNGSPGNPGLASGWSVLAYGGVLHVANSILASNASGNCSSVSGTIEDGGYNLDSGTSCRFWAPNHSLSNTDPMLIPLANNGGSARTMALWFGSPAIDAGGTSANGCPATDQRGVSRPQGTACDIGAYELVPGTRQPPPIGPGPAPYPLLRSPRMHPH